MRAPGPVMPSEVRELQAKFPRWLPAYIRWSAGLPARAPRWVPGWVRWLPMRSASAVILVYARGWL